MQIRAAGFLTRSSGTAYRVMHFFKHGLANLSSYSTAVHTRVPPRVHMEESDAPYRCYTQLNLVLEYCRIEKIKIRTSSRHKAKLASCLDEVRILIFDRMTEN
jgi:hypothetical protein